MNRSNKEILEEALLSAQVAREQAHADGQLIDNELLKVRLEIEKVRLENLKKGTST